jgi:hypothetical protein
MTNKDPIRTLRANYAAIIEMARDRNGDDISGPSAFKSFSFHDRGDALDFMDDVNESGRGSARERGDGLRRVIIEVSLNV